MGKLVGVCRECHEHAGGHLTSHREGRAYPENDHPLDTREDAADCLEENAKLVASKLVCLDGRRLIGMQRRPDRGLVVQANGANATNALDEIGSLRGRRLDLIDANLAERPVYRESQDRVGQCAADHDASEHRTVDEEQCERGDTHHTVHQRTHELVGDGLLDRMNGIEPGHDVAHVPTFEVVLLETKQAIEQHTRPAHASVSAKPGHGPTPAGGNRRRNERKENEADSHEGQQVIVAVGEHLIHNGLHELWHE